MLSAPAHPTQVTGGSRTIFDARDAWQAAWPFVTATANAPMSSVMDIKLVAGCQNVAACGIGGASCNATTNKCQCRAGYYGAFCQTYCEAATTCAGRGVCANATGACQARRIISQPETITVEFFAECCATSCQKHCLVRPDLC
jgi:hypothetical protein